jgi:DNA gyrase/topoisomerase IV subunit B
MQPMDSIESIRLRPGMYIGSTKDYMGLLLYLAEPITTLLREPSTATWLDVSGTGVGYVVESDGAMRIEEVKGNKIRVFELMGPPEWGDAIIVNALSAYLDVYASAAGVGHRLRFQRGVRKFHEKGEIAETRTRLAFAPDPSIFESTKLPSAIIESFLRRLSFLHPGVRFRYLGAEGTREYHAPGGIADLFTGIASPFQLVSTPVHIRAAEQNLRLELIFSYHSWFHNSLCCFINTVKAVGGGTHEKGLVDAFEKLPPLLGMRRDPYDGYNGVVAVMSIDYPDVTKVGSKKERVDNPELRDIVSRLVVRGVLDHVAARPDLAPEFTRTWIWPHPESNFF